MALAKQRREAAAQLERRLRMQNVYRDPKTILDAASTGDVLLVRASWLLARAGYVAKEAKRRAGRKKKGGLVWSIDPEAGPCAALPHRQLIEAAHPEAILSPAALRKLHENLANTWSGVERAPSGGVPNMPVVVVTHCWEAVGHPDPHGPRARASAAMPRRSRAVRHRRCRTDRGRWLQRRAGCRCPWRAGATLRKVAAQLASDMSLVHAWGIDDVGVLIDWCSLYQHANVPRTESETESFENACEQMGVWFSHNLTAVYLVTDQQLPPDEPPRRRRGWPLFEEVRSTPRADDNRAVRATAHWLPAQLAAPCSSVLCCS
jgi:hypothetical protein